MEVLLNMNQKDFQYFIVMEELEFYIQLFEDCDTDDNFIEFMTYRMIVI